jgi:outer membrane biosynthesis protein TonB
VGIRAVIFSVSLAHLLFLCLIIFKSPLVPEKKSRKPILVKTVSVQQPIKQETPSLKKAVAQHKPRAPEVKKTKSASPKVPAKPAPPVPAPTRQTPSISPSLLQELEAAFTKIEAKGDKHKKVTAPPKILPLQIDAAPDDSADYVSLLTEHLHAALHLPDFGEVKIELTLQQDGRVAKLKVLKAESEQNKKYLEARLLHMKLPALTGKKEEHTFTLTFCNQL